MRVTLVHPAGSNWIPGQKDITVTANRMVPTGLISMAAYLEKESRHAVAVYDCLGPKAPRTINARVDAVLATHPDLVGFSATTSGFLDGVEMAKVIKKQRSDLAIVFGGVHVSSLGAELLEKWPVIDYLVMGEGEVTLKELADGTAPKDIDGLVYRDDEGVKTNPPRKRIRDLDTLPFPAYEKIEGFPRHYRLPPFSYINTPGASISTSRGCMYRCDYCVRTVFDKGFRYNSAEYTFEHMKWLRTKFNVRHCNIYDDLFTYNRKRVMSLCDMLASAKLGLHFNCAVRIGHTDDELLEALKDAGCLMVSIGMESGDPELIQTLKSGVTLDQVRETVAAIQKHGLRAKGLFMMGVKGETPQSFQRTSDFIISLGLDDMNLSKFTPFPGAPCWPTIHDFGTLDEDWRLMNALNFVFVPNGFASKAEMDAMYNTHVKRFYNDPTWRKKFTRRLWQHRKTLGYMLWHLPAFLAAKKHFEPPKGSLG